MALSRAISASILKQESHIELIGAQAEAFVSTYVVVLLAGGAVE